MGLSNVTGNVTNLHTNTELNIDTAKECTTLWNEFEDIPMNPYREEIEQEWNGFPKGTHREEIWHWFEKHYNISVTELINR